jgi:hypothetical protein
MLDETEQDAKEYVYYRLLTSLQTQAQLTITHAVHYGCEILLTPNYRHGISELLKYITKYVAKDI